MSYEVIKLSPQMIHRVDGETINLTGEDIEVQIPGNKNEPPRKVKVRGAKQEDLKKLYEEEKYGNFKHIIRKKGKQ